MVYHNKAIDYMSAGIPLIVSGIESGIYEGIYNKEFEDLCISFVELAGLSEVLRRNISKINKNITKTLNPTWSKKIKRKIKLLLNFRH